MRYGVKEVEANEVVADILREIFSRYTGTIMLTIPAHFGLDQKQALLTMAENATNNMTTLIDEQVILAQNLSQKQNFNGMKTFILVNYSNPKIVISLFHKNAEIDARQVITVDDSASCQDNWFENVINQTCDRKAYV